MDEWQTVDLSSFEHVSFYGSNPVDAASKDDYFESLFYSHAIVGLNTSAFLEGAIVGRPVHTVLLPEFHENQEGVLHFHYLLTVGGGVLRAGRSFAEHHAQLAASLRQPSDRPGVGFVREFIRPLGLDRAATPLFCDAIDALLQQPRPEPVPTPVRYVALRWVMYPAFQLLRWLYGSEVFRDDWSRKEAEQERRRLERERRREERRQAYEQQKRDQERRRSEELAAKEAAQRAAVARREEALAAKAKQRLDKERDKETRIRRRRRAELRAGLKRRALQWLDRFRPRADRVRP
jgi:hypothetical protein